MRKCAVFAFMLFAVMGIKAQEISTQDEISKKKEINKIKLSEEAVYAEVVELVSDDYEAVSLAQQKSIDKLQVSVIEACAKKMNMSKEDVKEIFDVIDDKCQNVVIKKGDLLRVFTYITKDAIGLGRKKPKQEDLEEIFGEDSNVKAESKMLSSVELKNDENANSISEVSSQVQEIVPEVKVERQAESSSSVVQEIQEKVVSSEVEPKPVSVPEVPQVSSPVPEVEVVVPALCQTMLSKGNMNDLLRYLNQEKRYQRLMFGNLASMQYPGKCYVVIIDKSSRDIVSILDKGDDSRMNFVTKRLDHYNNYRGGNYAAIFVQEY